MKNTKQKKVILDIINNSNNHLDAYQIYDEARKQISNISLGTVYRNLLWLSENDKIRTIIVDDVIRYDRNVIHDHLLCTKCGNIIDIPRKSSLDNYVNGNLVIDYDIKYKGICKKCLERKD